ncbi:MAG TPA: hypothetical protein VGE17_05250 [Methylophilus sp.]
MVERILFVTLSNIGDAVLTTPALMLLHRQYPQAIVDIVCDPRSAALFSHCPFRGRLLLRDKRDGWRGCWQLMQHCRQVRYDLIVDLKTDWLHHVVPAVRKLSKSGAPERYLPWSSRAHYIQDPGRDITHITVEQVLPLLRTILA